jgi:hypothetical protein
LNATDALVAEAILAVHLAIIAFNVLGFVVIPVGAWRRWRIVRVAWLRLLHLGVMAVVAGQALAGRACFLTVWQNELTGNRTAPEPLIAHWVNSLIYWNIPIWGFAIFYSALFLYILTLTVLVPFGRSRRKTGGYEPRESC